MPSRISKIELFSYDLTYVGGRYVMSGGRVVETLSSTVVGITTDDGYVGYGETCPLGSNYLPAHAAGARAALEELGPHLIGLDAANPVAVWRTAETVLQGHAYAKGALDVACWDVLGQAAGLPICDLIGGRQQATFNLYVAIPLGTPEQMRADVERHRAAGIRHFQLKLGSDPVQDAERARAVVEATQDGEVVSGDANCGWTLNEAITAVGCMGELPRFYLEQPCRTLEECLRVRDHSSLPMILDEIIVDVPSLLRAWEAHALEGFNLKLSRVGGLTPGRVMRDLAESLGLIVNIEDAWGGDLTTAAVSHLAASTDRRTLQWVPFMNDWTNEHVAGYQPRSDAGSGAAPDGPGLGVEVDRAKLGVPFAVFEVDLRTELGSPDDAPTAALLP
jgi:L-alanine-DL-glutamate epimerase-like enolase superfamily enzyme